jgi:choline dehydrogenase-like flavoprotein
MPTAAAVNPSLTIAANALRIAARMAGRVCEAAHSTPTTTRDEHGHALVRIAVR